jgi:CDP-glycerol glycerophosphotransferase (TagB/SpsB family)
MNRRIWALPINIILFNLCYLIPFRKNNLWVYGAREGCKYDDNSMYLFEYMNKNHPEIESIWLTGNIKALELVRAKGYKAYLNNSFKGKMLQVRAGVVVYSHGLIDFGTFPLVAGAELVAVWHGMGFKKIYNGKFIGWKLKLKRALDHMFSWTRRTMTPVPSIYSKNWANEMFTLNYDEIVITGQPRNDAFKLADKESIYKAINVPIDKQTIIFMPTYRMPSLGDRAMENIVRDLYYSKELNAVLEATNSVFLTKLHPLTPHINLTDRDNFRILDYAAVESNQELMGVCDMLVTDYSSCFVDYALLERPIIFYNPDNEAFLAKSEKMDDGFWEICNLNRAITPGELAYRILHPSMAAVDKTNEVFEDPSIKGTCYSENVYNAIVKEINL